MARRITKEEKETFFFNPYEEEGIKEFKFPEVDKATLDWINMMNSGTSKVKPKKEYKEANIMKCRSDLKKNENGKMVVITEMKLKGLDDKVKRALRKSVIREVNKQIEGGTIQLDLSSDDEDKEEMSGEGLNAKKPRGRSRKNDNRPKGTLLEKLILNVNDDTEPIVKTTRPRGRPRKVEGGKVDLGKALGIKPKKGSTSYNARND